MIAGRRADFVLFILTVVELGILLVLVPRFTATLCIPLRPGGAAPVGDWLRGVAARGRAPRHRRGGPEPRQPSHAGRGFGLRPALRRLATTGPYRLV
jgi:hypothetical protein